MNAELKANYGSGEIVNHLSLPELVGSMRSIDEQKNLLNSNSNISWTDRIRISEALTKDKAKRLMLILGERENPEYNINVAFYTTKLIELHEYSLNKFEIDINKNDGTFKDKVDGSLKSLRMLPFLQGDINLVTDVLKPDEFKPENPIKYAKRLQREIRLITREQKQFRRKEDYEKVKSLVQMRDRLITSLLKTRINEPSVRNELKTQLRKGEYELLITSSYTESSSGHEEFASFTWTKDRDELVLRAGGYDSIDPKVIDDLE